MPKNHSLDDYMTAKDAAEAIGINYQLLMARIRKGKIRVKKMGWATLIHKDEVRRARKEQRAADAEK